MQKILEIKLISRSPSLFNILKILNKSPIPFELLIVIDETFKGPINDVEVLNKKPIIIIPNIEGKKVNKKFFNPK